MNFDLVIAGGQVLDGAPTEPARSADIGILGDRIAAVGDLADASARERIDATGRVVAPGFVDVHLHSEAALLGGPHRYGALLQGVTTQLMAPDGFGWAPLPPRLGRELWEYTSFANGAAPFEVDFPTPESYLALFTGNTPANLAPQVPHCAVRLAVMGWDARPAADDELAAMKERTRRWLDAGAVALNLGLDYQPSAYADTRELIELSKVAREAGAIYAAHVRYNDLGDVDSWRETMAISRAADIPVHISHEYITDLNRPLLEEARDTCDLTFESYMYPAGCTSLAMMLPIWAQAGGLNGLRARLRDPAAREAMRDRLQRRFSASFANGARPVFAVTTTGRYVGQAIDEISPGEPIGDVALRLLAEEDPVALLVYHNGTPPDRQAEIVRETVRHPKMMVASDGVYHGDYSHPRGYGCFARVLRLCVREMGALPLEEAVYKMAGFPAQRFRLADRGYLRLGYGADVVIFDPETVADRATWDDSRAHPVGIDRVLVNGQTVVLEGQPTGALPGRVLRRG